MVGGDQVEDSFAEGLPEPFPGLRRADRGSALEGDAAVGDLAMMEPTPPDEAVPLLPLGRVGEEGSQELAAPLLAALAYALLKPTLLAMGARVRSSAAAPPPPGG